MRQQDRQRLGRTGRRGAIILGVCASAVMAGAVPQAQAESLKPSLQWTQAPTNRQPALLSDVDSRAGATWAVGVDLVADFEDVRPLAMRWQGGKWTAVPQPVRTNAALNSVAVVNATNVWAVGEDRADPAASKPLVMHWNGKVWKIVPGPKVPAGAFGDVQVGSDGTVWVTGWANVEGREHAAVYRYTGKTWEPLTKGLEGSINGNTLAVLSKNDAWLGLNGGLAHYDGNQWQLVSEVSSSQVPTAIAVKSPNDIWLAGVDHGSGVPVGSSLLLHYDGTTWTRIAAPAGSTQLYDLTLRNGRPVAVGEKSIDAESFASSPLVLEYNGKQFVQAASPTKGEGTLTGIATAGNRLWAVGVVSATPTDFAAYAAHTR